MKNLVGGIVGLRKGIEAVILQVKSCNLQCLDFFLPVSQELPSINKLESLLKKINLPLSFHFKNTALLTDPLYYDLIKEQTVRYLELASCLKVGILTIHPPSTRRKNKKAKIIFKFKDENWFFESLDSGVSAEYKQSKETFLKYLSEIKPMAEKYKVFIAIENTDKNERDFGKRIEGVKEVIEIIDTINSPYIQMCLDVYKAYTTNDLFVGNYLDKIIQVQLSDFSSKLNKGHISLGKGDIPIRDIIQQLSRNNYKGNYIIEVPEVNLKDSVIFLNKIINHM